AWVEAYDRRVWRGEAPADGMLASAEQERDAAYGELTRDNYLDVTFPPAGLAVTNGRASRGTRVPIPDLMPGEYDLVMTITDLHAKSSATASTWFQVLSPEQRADLVSMARGDSGHSR
ncbi:MAG TPA: hypothetical protein VF720_00350, partial [Candidatus Eisenbacteria bacterium]